MDYATFRSQIQSGDLLAWSTHRDKGWRRIINHLIRIFTMSEYCHVGIAWVINERVFVIEAVQPCVRIYPLSTETPFYHIAMNLQVKDNQLNYLLSRVGEPYSVWQALYAYFGKPKSDKAWQCAELCNSFYRKVGIPLKGGWTPSALVEAILGLSDNNRLTFVSR
jgi:uncharacterized protein YycO